ncbi:MAG: PilN domain-containing protein [Desulfohalobiaceae bacterium]|nr:PilN domain-containing protein [Desulfohalobiaceae bacterium]
MLNINLLPGPRKAISTGPPRFTFLLIVLLVLLAIGGLFLQNNLQSRIDRLEQTQNRKQEKRDNLKKKLSDIHSVKNKLKEIDNKLSAIEDIRKKQKRPLHYLNGLIVALPPEKIWFNSIRMQQNKNMKLQGIALDNQAFAQYVGSLRETDFFKGITLKQTNRKSVSNLELVSFQFTLLTK